MPYIKKEWPGWLVEMAKRGVGLQPREFLDFVQKIINQDKRKNCFQDGRPGRDWYRKFMARNSHIVAIVKEKPLEFSRSKLTRDEMDRWFSTYQEFLISKDILDKPERIWNADECGFSMGFLFRLFLWLCSFIGYKISRGIC